MLHCIHTTSLSLFLFTDIEFYVTCEKPEPEWVSVNLRHVPPSTGTVLAPLPNGSSTEDILDDNQALKRSQSNSSLDEQTAHNGSPKPVIRRKVKPAPLPPTSNSMSKSSETTPTHNYEPPKPSSQPQPQRPPPVDAQKSTAVTKREGMWIPPSPSQMNTNRLSYVPQPSIMNPSAPKVVPPKPPQPTFLKDKTTSTESTIPTASSTLRHKTSFRSPSKADSADSVVTGASGQYISASLPRRFHTENSYKNSSTSKPPVMDIFSAKPDALNIPTSSQDSKSPNKTPTVGNNEEPEVKPTASEKTQIQKVKDETKTSQVEGGEMKAIEVTSPPLIGFESIVSGLNDKRQGTGIGHTSPESKEVSIGTRTNKVTTPTESSRPVPAPRSSLQFQRDPNPDSKVPATGPQDIKRPSVKAKPRDLGKRAHGEIQPLPTHCRNSSGSGPDESEGEVLSDGKNSTPSSQSQSRAHSRTDSNVEEGKPNDMIGAESKEGKTSIPSEEEFGSDPHGNGNYVC